MMVVMMVVILTIVVTVITVVMMTPRIIIQAMVILIPSQLLFSYNLRSSFFFTEDYPSPFTLSRSITASLYTVSSLTPHEVHDNNLIYFFLIKKTRTRTTPPDRSAFSSIHYLLSTFFHASFHVVHISVKGFFFFGKHALRSRMFERRFFMFIT